VVMPSKKGRTCVGPGVKGGGVSLVGGVSRRPGKEVKYCGEKPAKKGMKKKFVFSVSRGKASS